MSVWNTLRERYSVSANPLRTERRLELVLLLLCLVLALQLLFSGARLVLPADPDSVLPSADAMQVNAVQRLVSVSSEQSQEIRQRPVFWPTRRPLEPVPVEPEPEVVVEKASEIKDVKLLGVFGSNESSGIIALVKGKKRRILQGEKLEGWTIEKVEPSRVLLVDGPRSNELTLRTGTPVAPDASQAPSEDVNDEASAERTEGGAPEPKAAPRPPLEGMEGRLRRRSS